MWGWIKKTVKLLSDERDESVEGWTYDDIKKGFSLDVEWDVFNDDGGGDYLIVRVLRRCGRRQGWWINVINRRRGTASGGKVRIVLGRERAIVRIVEPLLEKSEDWKNGRKSRWDGRRGGHSERAYS